MLTPVTSPTPPTPPVPQQLASSGKVEVTGTLVFRDAEGKIVGETPFVWAPSKEVLE